MSETLTAPLAPAIILSPFEDGSKVSFFANGLYRVVNHELGTAFNAVDKHGSTMSENPRAIADCMADHYPLAREVFSVTYARRGDPNYRPVKSIFLANVNGLNHFSEAYLQELGANDQVFEYASAQGEHGEFSYRQQNQARPNGVELVSNGQYLAAHDVFNHGLAKLTTPAVTMAVARKLSAHIEELFGSDNPDDQILADKLLVNMWRVEEEETNFRNTFGQSSELVSRGYRAQPKMLSAILGGMAPHQDVVPYARDFIERAGLAVEGDEVVWERDEGPAYYEKIWARLAERPREANIAGHSLAFIRRHRTRR